MKTKLKPGFKWREGDQVPTRTVSLWEIMSDPKFAQGVADVRAKRPFPADLDEWGGHDAWCYERGRQWATAAPRKLRLKSEDGFITEAAMNWYRRAEIL